MIGWWLAALWLLLATHANCLYFIETGRHVTFELFTSRELEVLRLVARGHTLDEVARQLGVSRHTVRTFVRRIYAKLQVKSRADAVRVAAHQGLLDGS